MSSTTHQVLAVILGAILFLTGLFLYPVFIGAVQPIRSQSHEIILPDEPKWVTVYVTGMVWRPGVYTLQRGSRVQDLLRKAGGAKKGWDPDRINLAKRLADEDMIQVPQKPSAPLGQNEAPIPPDTSGTKGAGPKTKKIPPQGAIRINQAGEADWEKLPGIGPSMAERIIAYRKTHGGFHSLSDLKNVSGFGEKKFDAVKSYLKL